MDRITTKIKVLVLEEQTLMRSAIVSTIREYGTGVVITEATNYLEGLDLANEENFDVIVCDISIHVDNVLLVNYFRQISQSAAILVYSGYNERIYALPSIEAGADGYLSKQSSKDHFKNAWRAIVSKKRYLSPVVQELLLAMTKDESSNLTPTLSKREFEIMQLLRRYKSTKDISDLLGLKSNTISIHKKRIFQKLGITDEREFHKSMLSR